MAVLDGAHENSNSQLTACEAVTRHDRAGGAPAFPRARRPCERCPYKIDTPPGEFDQRRFDELAKTAGAPGAEVGLGGEMFGCHKVAVNSSGCACAGWLVVCGHDHLGVRLALGLGRLNADDVTPGEDWPALYVSFAAMVAAQAKPDYLENPVSMSDLRNGLSQLEAALHSVEQLETLPDGSQDYATTMQPVRQIMGRFTSILTAINGHAGDVMLWLLHVRDSIEVPDLVELTSWDEVTVRMRLDRETVRRAKVLARDIVASATNTRESVERVVGVLGISVAELEQSIAEAGLDDVDAVAENLLALTHSAGPAALYRLAQNLHALKAQ